MKLRIRENTIRLRMSQSEVEEFADKGSVETVTRFAPEAEFCYRITRLDGATSLQAHLDGQTITIAVPEADARDWAATNRVGIEGEMPIGNEETLSILIEKDFQCLNERAGEDESDMFPNPNAGMGHG